MPFLRPTLELFFSLRVLISPSIEQESRKTIPSKITLHWRNYTCKHHKYSLAPAIYLKRLFHSETKR